MSGSITFKTLAGAITISIARDKTKMAYSQKRFDVGERRLFTLMGP